MSMILTSIMTVPLVVNLNGDEVRSSEKLGAMLFLENLYRIFY
jgi:hypothetical protein